MLEKSMDTEGPKIKLGGGSISTVSMLKTGRK